MNTIISLPESAWRVTRREFFQRLGGTSAAAATFAGSFAGNYIFNLTRFPELCRMQP